MENRQDYKPDNDVQARTDSRPVRYALLAAVYLCLTLPFLGKVPLIDPDEGYYPATAQEMIVQGRWLDPVFNGEPRWGKPVGFYLLEIFSFKVLGFSEFSARLPSLLAGLGFVLLAAALGAGLYNARTGFYAGLFCATAIQPVVYARTAVPDMLLSFFICLSLYGFMVWERSPEGRGKLRGLVLLYLGAALAFLAKGPLGAILPGITVAAYLLFSGGFKKIHRLGLWWGVPLFLLVVAPWFFYMYSLHGSAFLEEFFLQRNIQRYFTDRWEHPGPVYYYLPILLLGAFPWTLAMAGGAVRSLGRLIFPGIEPDALQRTWNSELFTWCWFGAMLIFFSLSSSKLPNYVLPLYPAAALFSGHFLTETEESPEKKRPAVLVGGTALLALAALAAGVWLVPSKVAIPRAAMMLTLAPLCLVPLGALAFILKRRLAFFWGISAAAMALIFALLSSVALPQADRFRAIKSLSLSRLDRLESHERILCLQTWKPSLLFYTGRKAVRFNPYKDCLEDFLEDGGRWVLTCDRSLSLLDSLTGGLPPAELHRIGDCVLLRLGREVKQEGIP